MYLSCLSNTWSCEGSTWVSGKGSSRNFNSQIKNLKNIQSHYSIQYASIKANTIWAHRWRHQECAHIIFMFHSKSYPTKKGTQLELHTSMYVYYVLDVVHMTKKWHVVVYILRWRRYPFQSKFKECDHIIHLST